MDPERTFLFQAFLFLLMVGFAASTTFISDAMFDSRGPIGRNLLQTRKACSVNFEFMNYTIITSMCKGPQYSPKLCCQALKDFACPYADAINDGSTDCASTMFSYINLYGKYPPGLFASECREGKEGLACPADEPKATQKTSKSNADRSSRTSFVLVLVSTFVLGFLFG